MAKRLNSAYVAQRLAEVQKQGELAARSVRRRHAHVCIETTRHGKKVFYYRERNGTRIRLPDPHQVGNEAFNLAYLAATRGQNVGRDFSRERPLPSYALEQGRPGFVYFLRMGDTVKIGFSAKVGSRLKSIQTACPEPAEVMKIIPGSDQTERYFHAHFQDYRLKGEWFALEGALAAFLAVKV